MLYLHPPFYVIDGVSILPDHEDPTQFYFMPLVPRLGTATDSATGLSVPQLSLVKFRGEAGNGGFLDFDVNLGLDDERRTRIESKLQSRAGLRDKPRLTPIPVVGGSVKLMMLGADSADPPTDPATDPAADPSADPSTAEPVRFVVKMEHAASPSLYGDNQAAFSVQLDQAGVTVMERALQGEMAPIGVVYRLDYLALRPLYAYRIKADWSRVQTHFEETFGFSLFFASSEVTKVIDQLIEDEVIDIQLDTFVLENEANTDVLSRRDAIVAEVQRMVLESFFEASLEPVPQDKPDETMETVSNVALLLATGGLAGACGFRYRKVDLTRIDKKTLDINVNERGVVKQSIYPQGHLAGLFQVLREPGIELDRFVTSVDLDDPWFRRRRLKLIPRVDFGFEQVASLDVRLDYQGNITNRILERESDRPEIEWDSVVRDGAMVREVAVGYKVSFANADTSERPLALESVPRVVDVDVLEIQPRELYAISEVPIIALDFPWETYPAVEVRCRYDDPDQGIALADDFLLTKEASTKSWRLFLLDRTRTEFRYQLVYRAASQRDIVAPEVLCSDEQIIVRDPRPSKLQVNVVANVRWTEVERVFVDLTYHDRVNHVRAEESFEFDQNRPEPQRFRVPLEDPTLRAIEYTVTFLMVDGTRLDVPRSRMVGSRLIVRPDMRGHRVIRVAPNPVEFESRRMSKIEVDLRFSDEEAGLSFEDRFEFRSHEDEPGLFEIDYVDPARDGYSYRITYTYGNGLSRMTDWAEARSEELFIPID